MHSSGNIRLIRRPTPDARERIDAILAQIDRIPDRPDPFDPFDWGKNGLPR